MGKTDIDTGAPQWVVWMVGFLIGAVFLAAALAMAWVIILLVHVVMHAA